MRGKAPFIFHSGVGYFADEYGLEQVAIEVEGKEPSDRELTAVLTRAATRGGAGDLCAAADCRSVGTSRRRDTYDPGAQLDLLATDIPQAILQAAKAIAGAYGPLADEE